MQGYISRRWWFIARIVIYAIIAEIIVSDAEVKFTNNRAIYQQIYIIFHILSVLYFLCNMLNNSSMQ